MGGAEVAGCQDEDFEGEELGFHHNEAGEGELNHRSPVAEGASSEAIPALAPVNKVDVEEEEDREQVVGDGDRDGSADEAPLELPHKKPVHKRIERRSNKQDVRGRAEETLGLDVAFAAFEERIAWSSKDQDAEIEACEFCRLLFGNYDFEYSL